MSIETTIGKIVGVVLLIYLGWRWNKDNFRNYKSSYTKWKEGNGIKEMKEKG